MLANRREALFAPTAMGALMDPDFLRRAANDACAVRTSERPDSAPVRTIVQTWRARSASLSACLRAWHAGRFRASPQPVRLPWKP
jgi:hypothetical protein